MKIKHRYTQEVLLEIEATNLCGANLHGANLYRANLNGEKLKTNPVIIYGLTWDVLITNEFLTIGCQRHSHAEWEAFSNDQIAKMESRALRFWQEWKRPLLSMCSIHSKKEE